ncbi:MAG TPA: spermidine/putrescine ABC transporter permease [Citreicella sp.]|nr:spermidine/putrescine ABC transporter permease [Citreicella sp.]
MTLNRALFVALLLICTLWLALPFGMAILWSLVDASTPWTPDHILPPAISLDRWRNMLGNPVLQVALLNSYLLAPTAALMTLTLTLPTAYALGRIPFRGREIARMLTLLPLVVPGFVTAIFLTALLHRIGFTGSRFWAVAFSHALLFLPYAIRILSVSFEQVRQDHIDAARDLGASPLARFRVAWLPALKPGLLAAFLIVFIQSIEEFAIAFILGSPDFTTIPTLLYPRLGQDFVRPDAAVLSLILVLPNVILMLILEQLLRSANPSLSSGKG